MAGEIIQRTIQNLNKGDAEPTWYKKNTVVEALYNDLTSIGVTVTEGPDPAGNVAINLSNWNQFATEEAFRFAAKINENHKTYTYTIRNIEGNEFIWITAHDSGDSYFTNSIAGGMLYDENKEMCNVMTTADRYYRKVATFAGADENTSNPSIEYCEKYYLSKIVTGHFADGTRRTINGADMYKSNVPMTIGHVYVSGSNKFLAIHPWYAIKYDV